MATLPPDFRSSLRSTRARALRAGAVALRAAASLALLLSALGGADGALARAAAGSSAGITAVQVSATAIPAGGDLTAIVTLGDKASNASGGVTVYLSYARSVFAGPRLIRIPNGARTGAFTLRSNPYLGTATAALVIASTSSPDPYGMVARQITVAAAAPLPATPRPEVAAVTFSPATVGSGQAAAGTVTLTGPAPAGGAVVQLASSYDLFGQIAEVPATVVVPEGASSVQFLAPTHLAPPSTTAALPVTGSYFGGPWTGSWLEVVAP